MTCTRCGSPDVYRSRRKGAWDNMQAWFGRWPYRCDDCGLRFAATGRNLDRESLHSKQEQAQTNGQNHRRTHTRTDGAEMAFQAHPGKPQAKIVVQAETHEQLNHILLSLDKAISSYQKGAPAESHRPSHASR